MAISLICPKCRKAVKAPESLAGKKAACPGCKTIALVPRPSDVRRAAGAGAPDRFPPGSPAQSRVPPPIVAPVEGESEDPESGGMSRQMLAAMIAVPVLAVICAVAVVSPLAKSRQAAHRREAQLAAQKIFDDCAARHLR